MQYAPSEYAIIAGQRTPEHKLDRFYRFWTLKESLIKAVGNGLPAFHLAELEFRPDPSSVLWSDGFDGHSWVNHAVVDTTTLLHNVAVERDASWRFEANYVDEKHCIAVALDISSSNAAPDQTSRGFRVVDAGWVLQDSEAFS